jgi:DNA modification methylase
MKIIQGDCVQVLKQLEENSVDSIVTDPPYGLEFMGKEWDKFGAEIVDFNEKEKGGFGGYKKHIRFGESSTNGFQEFCYDWAKECLRVLKPGGHLLSFGGTRTYHRMACAIEDAGFEVRDMVEYIYGSGFPKSLNINKQYEKTQQKTKSQLQNVWKRILLQTEGQKENNRGNLQEMLEDLEQGKQYKIFTSSSIGKEIQIPKRQKQSCLERWSDLPTPQGELSCKCKVCSLPTGFYFYGKKGWLCYGTQVNNGEISWEVIDESGVCSSYQSQSIRQSFRELDVICEQCFAQILREWSGFGTSLKPSHEPICLARKPLAEKTVAENVLKYGTGGINIDESRVEASDQAELTASREQFAQSDIHTKTNNDARFLASKKIIPNMTPGRFPANLIHDNSEEVRECFPDTGKGNGKGAYNYAGREYDNKDTSMFNGDKPQAPSNFNDSGNASRFFKSIIYTAKASKSERNKGCEGLEEKSITNAKGNGLGRVCNICGASQLKPCECENNTWILPIKNKNNHPTVKPIALMSYLIKMITPKGGIVLDPFSGSGSTLVAAKENGFDFIGIEKEPEYIKIIEARTGIKAEVAEIKEVKTPEIKKEVEIKSGLSKCCNAKIIKGYCEMCCEKV